MSTVQKEDLTVNAIDLRRQLGDLLNRVYYQNIEIHVKRRGKLVAKVINATQENAPEETDLNEVAPSTAKNMTISAVDIRRQLGDLLNRVYYQNIEVFIERRSKVVAKIVPFNKEQVQGPTPSTQEPKEKTQQTNSTSDSQEPEEDKIEEIKRKLQEKGYDEF